MARGAARPRRGGGGGMGSSERKIGTNRGGIRGRGRRSIDRSSGSINRGRGNGGGDRSGGGRRGWPAKFLEGRDQKMMLRDSQHR